VPPPFGLEPATVVDIVASWCSWSSEISLKIECLDPWTVTYRVWVGGWGGGLIDFGQRFGVNLRLDEGVGSVVLVA
jgi:hypothetical protein